MKSEVQKELKHKNIKICFFREPERAEVFREWYTNVKLVHFQKQTNSYSPIKTETGSDNDY